MISLPAHPNSTSEAHAVKVNWQLVSGYRHPGVVARYEEKLNHSREAASQLFEDVKRMLYVFAVSDEPGLAPPNELMDEGWHNFLLFTHDYDAFCRRCFGRFIHHQPDDKEDVNAPRDPSRSQRTVDLARTTFRDLSENWRIGVTNCCWGSPNSSYGPGGLCGPGRGR